MAGPLHTIRGLWNTLTVRPALPAHLSELTLHFSANPQGLWSRTVSQDNTCIMVQDPLHIQFSTFSVQVQMGRMINSKHERLKKEAETAAVLGIPGRD